MDLAGGWASAVMLAIGFSFSLVGVRCSGDLSRAEYEEKVQERVADFASEVIGFRRELEDVRSGSASLDDVVSAAMRVRREATETAEELESVTPPANAVSLHAELVLALRAVASDVEMFAHVIDQRDVDAVRAFETGADGLRSLALLERACESFRANGYHVAFTTSER